MEKILLDTDIGGDIDDAICLAYLLKEPQCELLGITTVCGESEKRAAVADAICKAAGKDIPIVAGLDTTLQPVPVYPTPEGANALQHWAHNHFEKADAPTFMYQKIRENPHGVILIGIGNMTNIATMFQKYPDAAALLKGLYVMNGYFGAERLPEPWYNWNSWADPLASQIVFAANVSIHRAIPLEVTDMLTIKAEKARTLLSANSNLMNAVFDFGNAWLESSKKLTLHDPLVAVSIFYPDICRFQKGNVRVETNKENDMGATIFSSDLNGNVEVAVSVECEQFYRILSDTLNDGKTQSREWSPLVDNQMYKRIETTDSPIFLRKYRPEDAIPLASLFYETVHTVNIRDYTKEQVNAWATGRIDLEKWNQSFQEHYSIVAVANDTIIGFGDMDKSGYLDRLFVHKDYQSKGVATAICDDLEQSVQGEITVHASITAKPFFEKRGYMVLKEQQVVRQGIALTNYVMKKEKHQ